MSALVYCFISCMAVGILCQVHGTPSFYKPPVLILETEKGQVFDCIDFYKQPAFNNPLLFKDHINKAKLTILQSGHQVGNLGLKDGCPVGTVPILRSLAIPKYSSHNSTSNGDQRCTAVIQTKKGDRHFNGGRGSVTIFKAKVNGYQWSSGRMKLLNGPQTESVEAGWMVGSSECVNFLCSSGFVQTSKEVPLGIIPDAYSHIGDEHQQYWNITIEKHQDDGHWWLFLDDTPIGYWPKTLFTSLGEFASLVEWGGEIYNPGSATLQPEMGSGFRLADSTKKSAFYFDAGIFNKNFDYDNNPRDTENVYGCVDYQPYDMGYQGDYWGRLIFFGGPSMLDDSA